MIRRLSLAAALLVLAGTLARAQPAARPSDVPAGCRGADSLGLRLSFLDVGQGSSTLLTLPDGRHVLIDAGRSASLASELLHSRGVREVALVVATHNHADHIGGLPLLLSTFEVENLLENGVPTTTMVYDELVAAASGARVRVLEPTARTLNIGGLALRVLPPAGRAAEPDQNAQSIGLVAEYGGFRAIFSGDAGRATLGHWLATERIPIATVVLAGHHGAADATTPEWVAATSPAVVVIPVGRNPYGHPSPPAVALWSAPERLVLRTDQHAPIEMRGCADGSYALAPGGGAGSPR